MNFKQIYTNLRNSTIGKIIISSPKALEFFKGSLWTVTGAVFSKGLMFISWVIVARILGTEGYGQFGIIRSTVLMFTSFAGFSLGITASKHVAEFLNDEKQRTGRILGLTMGFGYIVGTIVGLIFYLISPWLASETLDAPNMSNELRIGALTLFFSSLNGAQMGALQGFMAFKKIAIINAIQGVLCFPLFILGALYFGVYGTVWAFALSYVIICILSHFTIHREVRRHDIRIDFVNAWKEKSLLFSYSLPAFLSGLMVTPVKWYADSLLISRGSFEEMGIFTAALTFTNIILVGVGMLSAPFLTVMAKNKNDSRNSKFSRFNILAPWAIGIFVASPFIVFPELGGYVFGKEFSGERFELPFIYVLLFTVIMMFKQGLSRVMAVYNLQWWSFGSNLIWGMCLIICFLSFREKNAYNLAISYLVAYVVNILVVLPVYYKRNLIPKKTIESIEAIIIWILIIIMAISGITLDTNIIKIGILAISLITISILLKILLSKSNYSSKKANE